ncbi:MAG TPA: hypothetical protein VGM66_05415, partial [Candidatus Udaeobacter sp.]
ISLSSRWLDSGKRRFNWAGARSGGRPTILGARRRRVRKDVRVEEEWLNPGGRQLRDAAKLGKEIRRADQRRLRSVIVAAGRDHRNGTAVLGTVRIRVDPLV